jgi:hypothetical protein
MGRILLFAAAALLAATATIHAAGVAMVEAWVAALDAEPRAAIRLVWLTDSADWAVAALIWAIAAWKQDRGWLGAAAVTLLIPLSVALGILAIDPAFFGAWLLVACTALAAAGIALSRREPAEAATAASESAGDGYS